MDTYGPFGLVGHVMTDEVMTDEQEHEGGMEIQEIVYQYELDDAAQFGADADMSNIDVCASYSAYTSAVLTELQYSYPGAQVAVHQGPPLIAVDGQRDHREIPWIEDIIHSTWSTFAWVRYTHADIAAALDTGLWVDVGADIIVNACEIDSNDGGIAWALSWHQGPNPAYKMRTFDTRRACLDAMVKIAPPNDWTPYDTQGG